MDATRCSGNRQAHSSRHRKESDKENNNYLYKDRKCWDWRARKVPEWITCYVCVGLPAVLCYVNNVWGDFVHDDIKAITTNPDVLGDTAWSELFRNDFWGKPMTAMTSHKSYRPLCVLSFRLNYLFGGLDPFGYHVVNNTLHCISTLLFTVICRRVIFVRDLPASYIAGLIFAVHPIHTEAVSSVVGRADILACIFFQTALISYLSIAPRRYCGLTRSGQWFPLVVTAVCAALALLSKEHGITVLGVCILYEGYSSWQYVRMAKCKTGTLIQSGSGVRILVLFSVLICLLISRLWMLDGQLPVFQEEDNPAAFSPCMLTRVLTKVYLWSFNIWLMLCPVHLSHDWQTGSIPLVHSLWDSRNIASVIFLVLLMGIIWICAFRQNNSHQGRLFWALALTTVPFVPASNIFVTVGFVVAERILYISSMGMVVLAVHCVDVLLLQRLYTNGRSWKVLLVLVLLLCPASRTVRRNMDWQSRESLARAGLRLLPRNAKMHYNFANVVAEMGNTNKAVEHYKHAIRLWPTYASAHNNLATHLTDTSEAVCHLSEAIRLVPCHTNAHTNLATIYLSHLNQTRAATSILHQAISCNDNNPRPYIRLAALYQDQGLYVLAEKYYKAAANLAPRHHNVHHNVGLFYESQGKYKSALSHLLKATDLFPDDHTIFLAVARNYKHLGNNDYAETYYERALSLNRDHLTLDTVATFFYNTGRPLRALDLFRDAYVKHVTIDSILHVAHTLSRLGLYGDAEELLKNHLSQFPRNLRLNMQLASVYGLHKDHQKAYELLKQYLHDHSGGVDKIQMAAVYHQMGNHIKDQKDMDKAALYYSESLKLDDANDDCHHNLAVYYHKKGKTSKALYHYSTALVLNPKDHLLRTNYNKFLQNVRVTGIHSINNATGKRTEVTSQHSASPMNYNRDKPGIFNTDHNNNSNSHLQMTNILNTNDLILSDHLDIS